MSLAFLTHGVSAFAVQLGGLAVLAVGIMWALRRLDRGSKARDEAGEFWTVRNTPRFSRDVDTFDD